MSISIAKMASIRNNDSKVTAADAELSFLDLKDCSLETRTYLLELLEDESKPKTPKVQAPTATPATLASTEAVATSVTQAQQQQPAQHHFQQVCLLRFKETFVVDIFRYYRLPNK